MTGFFRLPPGAPRTVRILASLGPLARDLDDLELDARSMSGPDGADTEVPPVPSVRAPVPRVVDLRLAYALSLPGAVVASSLSSEVEEAHRGALCQRQGARQSAPARLRTCRPVSTGSSASSSRPSPRSGRRRCLPGYLAALERRDQIIAVWDRFFSDFDALIVPPAMTSTRFRIARRALRCWSTAKTPSTLARARCWRRPAGFTARRAGRAGRGRPPIGVQIVGPRWSEMSLLNIARALESAQDLAGIPSSASAPMIERCCPASSNQNNVVEEDGRCWSFVVPRATNGTRSGRGTVKNGEWR